MALRTLLVTVTAAALLAGCAAEDAVGSTGTSAAALSDTPELVPYAELESPQIYRKVRARVRKADSVHVRMESRNAGAVLNVDMRVSRDGSATGWVSPTPGQRIALLRVGDQAWFKANRAFLDAHDRPDAPANGEWAEVTGRGGLDSYLEYTETGFYIDTPAELAPKAVGEMFRVGNRRFDGRSGVGLQAGTRPLTIYASTDGRGDLVGYVDDEIVYSFSEWDDPVVVEPPAPGE
ncbi:hypothetical protein [Kineosporia babensis]|uniref:Lipoprotein n=1 Tax=Kineosporia babensis TaxID=499548 RepID=A0A9X1SRJ1_9ACTN|nr:hypothetical protein [Kineosporia babensis]MCD5309687.1 hypothetical protein [Kineosporia babensis]